MTKNMTLHIAQMRRAVCQR